MGGMMAKVTTSDAFSEEMRAPTNGILGCLARLLMRIVNQRISQHMVTTYVQPTKGSTIVELGPGDGFCLPWVLAAEPAVVFAVEISPPFRASLARTFAHEVAAGTIVIKGSDASAMPFLADSSVDRVYGLNVIYFLDPLQRYLEEVYRVLKPGGRVIWGCRQNVTTFRVGEHNPFVNRNWHACTKAMRRVGFTTTLGESQLSGGDAYVPIIGLKPQ